MRIDILKSLRDKCDKKAIAIIREDESITYYPSRRWKYFNRLLQNAYRKRREQTKVYLYTVANKLFSQYDVVAGGSYTPRGGGINTGMRRAMNNQSLIARFKQILEWCAKRSGKIYIEWDERGSTRTCNRCGHKVSGGISPDIREWECEECTAYHIRDENAAINGLKYVYDKLKCLARAV